MGWSGGYVESDYKILFAEFFSEKYDPEPEQVNAYGYPWVGNNLLPGLLHLF